MSFDAFTFALSRADIEFEHLKVAQLAQAILESGRGSSDLFRRFKNPYGMKYRTEMEPFAQSVAYIDAVGETDQYCHFPDYESAVAGYWAFIERKPYAGWRRAAATAREYVEFIAYAGYVGGSHDAMPDDKKPADAMSKDRYIAAVVKQFAEAQGRLFAAQPKSAAAQTWKGKGVYIDVGHGPKPGGFDPGAVHAETKLDEHALNTIAAAACAHELRQVGVPVTVSDARVSNYQAGAAATQYDVFVSIHHNAINGKSAQGSEAIFHRSKGTAADRQLATLAAKAMANALGITNRGAKESAVAVLSGARDAKVRAAVLAELYFMHQQSPANPPPSDLEDWSARGGAALAGAICDWLQANV